MPLSNEVIKTNVDPNTVDANEQGVAGSYLGKYYTRILIGKYDRPKPFASPKFEQTMAIFLPIPNELRDDTSVSYTNINLETVGDIVNGAGLGATAGAIGLRKSGDVVETVLGAGKTILDAGGNAAGKTIGNITEAITSGVMSLFPAEQITSAIQQSLGVAPNPNPSVAFQGPVLRDFSYTWAFYPKSKEESLAIDALVKKLKAAALPSNYSKGTAAILNYPKMCQINFFPWDKGGSGDWFWHEKSIIRYKKCVMQGVNVNYNPFGTPAFFEDSHLPTSYTLTISFREIEYMLSHDWEGMQDVGAGDPSNITAGVISQAQNATSQAKTASEQGITDLGKAVLQ